MHRVIQAPLRMHPLEKEEKEHIKERSEHNRAEVGRTEQITSRAKLRKVEKEEKEHIKPYNYVDLSPRIRRASWISFGMIVTRFA